MAEIARRLSRNPAIRSTGRTVLDQLSTRSVNLANRGTIGLIDVGSGGGLLPSPWRSNAWRIRHLLRFEPRTTSPSRNAAITGIDAALWSESGERDLFVSGALGGSGSSLLRQNVDYVRQHYDDLKHRGDPGLAASWFDRARVDRVERLQCRTLDDVLHGLTTTYHFLKVDAQGADFQILRGSEHFLRADCLGIHCELFTIPLYQDMTLLPDVEDWLDQVGFGLVRTFPAHGTFDSQHDCLFLKRDATGPAMESIRRAYRL